MRAYLVDPQTKRLTIVQSPDDDESILCLLRCEEYRVHLSVQGARGRDAIYVGKTEQKLPWWVRMRLGRFRVRGTSIKVYGRGLIIGHDQYGERCEPEMSYDEVKRMIHFRRKKCD